MRRTVLLFTLLLSVVVCSYAQRPTKTLSQEERGKWLNEMRSFKHEFLVKELSLTAAQQDAFFKVYDAMDDELTKIAADTRELEQKVTDSSSDIEMETVARALFEQKKREGEVEVAYFEKLKSTITPKQLLRLKNAERKFTQQLVKHHGRAKAAGQNRKQ